MILDAKAADKTFYAMKCVPCNALIICTPMGRPPGHPRGTHGNPGELTGTQGKWYSFDISFFLAGEESCLTLETTSLDHGDIPTGLTRASATGKVKSALPGAMVVVWK